LMLPKLKLIEAVLAASERENHTVVGHLLGELGIIVAARFRAVASADKEK